MSRSIQPRPLKYFVDLRTGKYHADVMCPYTLPPHAWWAFPYYQQEI